MRILRKGVFLKYFMICEECIIIIALFSGNLVKYLKLFRRIKHISRFLNFQALGQEEWLKNPNRY